jgi:transcriptional regulator with XRE-family HTH domain
MKTLLATRDWDLPEQVLRWTHNQLISGHAQHPLAMATKETRLLRGRRRGQMLAARAVRELRDARLLAGLSLSAVADAVDIDQSNLWRFEAGSLTDLGIVRLSEIASVLGYEVSVGLHPIGDPLRDKGQLACGRRFDALLNERWRVTDETLLPGAGEQRAWDKLLRLMDATPRYLVGVDIESRVWDVQAIVRRTRQRERDGQVDHILIVLAGTAHNRRVADELRNGLGVDYQAGARSLLAGLRRGERLVGPGVVLV